MHSAEDVDVHEQEIVAGIEQFIALVGFVEPPSANC
jgi:hypothetical protein